MVSMPMIRAPVTRSFGSTSQLRNAASQFPMYEVESNPVAIAVCGVDAAP